MKSGKSEGEVGMGNVERGKIRVHGSMHEGE